MKLSFLLQELLCPARIRCPFVPVALLGSSPNLGLFTAVAAITRSDEVFQGTNDKCAISTILQLFSERKNGVSTAWNACCHWRAVRSGIRRKFQVCIMRLVLAADHSWAGRCLSRKPPSRQQGTAPVLQWGTWDSSCLLCLPPLAGSPTPATNTLKGALLFCNMQAKGIAGHAPICLLPFLSHHGMMAS